jgi:hypothetical protein
VTSPDTAAGEFGFELHVCGWAEGAWPPDRHTESAVIVGRQLGTRTRRWDTVVIEADPEALRDRAAFGPEPLDGDLLDVIRHAPEEWSWYQDALPHPGYPWRYVRESVHRAADRGILETRRGDGGRIEIRRIAAYPDWVNRLVAIENKPDLSASAAKTLGDQLRRDVAMALADEVWLATRDTGQRTEPALLADIPVEAGVLVVGEGGVSVQWKPARLAVDAPGTRVLSNPDIDGRDASAARFEYIDSANKQTNRLEIAERVYGRGWRSYVDTMRTDCRYFDVERNEHGWTPVCRAKCRPQRAAECSSACEDFEPEPPAWRQRGWPLDGGPGGAVTRTLRRRRRRLRPGLDE